MVWIRIQNAYFNFESLKLKSSETGISKALAILKILLIVGFIWNNTLLGASVNLVGKGIKAGANKAAEYNSEEAKQLREHKKEEKAEERKIAEVEEKRQAGLRKQKADNYREKGKPLTAYLVGINPTYLGIAAIIIGAALFIGGRKFGILFVGGISTLLVAFFGFIIKDFLKLDKTKGTIIILTLVVLSIGGTIGTYFYKKNNKNISSEMMEIANQIDSNQKAEETKVPEKINEIETAVASSNNTEGDKNSSNAPVSNGNNIVIGNWTGDFGKDQLTINIESIDESGNVKGYDEVKGNRRDLIGTINGSLFTLNEPGDDNWDGVFTFELTEGAITLKGEWKANNGKSTKQFVLNKN